MHVSCPCGESYRLPPRPRRRACRACGKQLRLPAAPPTAVATASPTAGAQEEVLDIIARAIQDGQLLPKLGSVLVLVLAAGMALIFATSRGALLGRLLAGLVVSGGLAALAAWLGLWGWTPARSTALFRLLADAPQDICWMYLRYVRINGGPVQAQLHVGSVDGRMHRVTLLEACSQHVLEELAQYAPWATLGNGTERARQFRLQPRALLRA